MEVPHIQKLQSSQYVVMFSHYTKPLHSTLAYSRMCKSKAITISYSLLSSYGTFHVKCDKSCHLFASNFLLGQVWWKLLRAMPAIRHWMGTGCGSGASGTVNKCF